MDSFEALVKKYRKRKSPQVIHNASKKHAEILIRNLLQEALEKNENIKIVSGNLDDKFYNNLAEELGDCLNAGIQVEVVVLNSRDLSGNRFAEKIRENSNGTLIQNNKDEEINFPHFVLVGENKFRSETNHNKARAIASFNNPSICETLSDIFEKIKNWISPNSFPARNLKRPMRSP